MRNRILCAGLSLLLAAGLAGCGAGQRVAITPESEGGPPEAIVASFGAADTFWVAAAGDRMLAFDLTDSGAELQSFHSETLEDGVVSVGSYREGSSVVDWNPQEILVYSESRAPENLRYRFAWSLRYEAQGARPRLDLTLLEGDADRFGPAEQPLSFYPLQLSLTGETGSETAEGARTPGDREQAALNELARMYLTHRKEADPAGDLSELLMGWRGQDAPVTFLANGLDPSLENRAACAAAAGIPDYTGTPEQDAALLDALGAGTRPWATMLRGAEE